MELYIRVQNGQPIGHPILKENLQQAFPNIDLTTTTDFAPFERVSAPAPGPYDKSINSHYGLVNGVYKDIWTVEPMTQEERLTKQNQVKQYWQEYGFASWVFNEETCDFDPPVAYPSDGLMYIWNESTGSWVVAEGSTES